MKSNSKFTARLGAAFLAAAIGASLFSPGALSAKQGATDPIPGTSNGTVKSGGGGGGGGKSSIPPAPAPAPVVVAPAPVQPLIVAPLTFSSLADVNGVTPLCTGSYRVDPYYPTLSLMTVYTTPTSLNVADGTTLYVTVNLMGGVGYPFTSNIIFIAGQTGTGTFSEYVTPGTTISSVLITDASGAIVFAGN